MDFLFYLFVTLVVVFLKLDFDQFIDVISFLIVIFVILPSFLIIFGKLSRYIKNFVDMKK